MPAPGPLSAADTPPLAPPLAPPLIQAPLTDDRSLTIRRADHLEPAPGPNGALPNGALPGAISGPNAVHRNGVPPDGATEVQPDESPAGPSLARRLRALVVTGRLGARTRPGGRARTEP